MSAKQQPASAADTADATTAETSASPTNPAPAPADASETTGATAEPAAAGSNAPATTSATSAAAPIDDDDLLEAADDETADDDSSRKQLVLLAWDRANPGIPLTAPGEEASSYDEALAIADIACEENPDLDFPTCDEVHHSGLVCELEPGHRTKSHGAVVKDPEGDRFAAWVNAAGPLTYGAAAEQSK